MNVINFLQFVPCMVVCYLKVAVYACVVQVCVIDAKPSLYAMILADGPGTLPAVVSTNV